MLYISSITDNLTMAPVPSAVLREQLVQEYEEDGGKKLYEKLMAIDPEVARTIHPNNKPYLIRAIETYELMKQPKSQLVSQSELRPREHAHSADKMFIIGMELPRDALHERIDQRTKDMFRSGWVDEVRALLAQGYGPDDPGMKSCGYREIMEALQSGQPVLEEALGEVIAAKTRQYARRQLTWWRGDNRIQWVRLV